MSKESERRSVLVVVGTTKFEDLIKAVSEKRFQKVPEHLKPFKTSLIPQLLFSKGYTHLSIQVGHGEYTPDDSDNDGGLMVEWFRFKPTLADDMSAASLIISHGGNHKSHPPTIINISKGSGSIFESLALRKTLVVVINETLMNNHQTELASRLAKDRHLAYTTSR